MLRDMTLGQDDRVRGQAVPLDANRNEKPPYFLTFLVWLRDTRSTLDAIDEFLVKAAFFWAILTRSSEKLK